MTEKIPYRLDADTAFQQPHGEGVSQAVGGIVPGGKAALAGPLREQVANRGVLQCAAGTAYAQEQLRVAALGPPVP